MSARGVQQWKAGPCWAGMEGGEHLPKDGRGRVGGRGGGRVTRQLPKDSRRGGGTLDLGGRGKKFEVRAGRQRAGGRERGGTSYGAGRLRCRAGGRHPGGWWEGMQGRGAGYADARERKPGLRVISTKLNSCE
jgi:hypothetical protein